MKLKPIKLKSWEDRYIYTHNPYTLWNPSTLWKYRSNGFACPDCGRELYDDVSFVLTSVPPQAVVKCLGQDCVFTSARPV